MHTLTYILYILYYYYYVVVVRSYIIAYVQCSNIGMPIAVDSPPARRPF